MTEQLPRFYQLDEQWHDLCQRLKLFPCPHCNVVGMLIRHGTLSGYDDQSLQQTTLRARRLFCSNRNDRRGCGRTVSVWLADKIHTLTLTAPSLWAFLSHAVTDGVAAAVRAIDSALSDRTWLRHWRRFRLAQSSLRTALSACFPEPREVCQPSSRPQAQTLAHLRVAFGHHDCPITAFQLHRQTFFV